MKTVKVNNYLNFIKKEFKHIFRDKLTLYILFILPVVQMFLFGYVIKSEIKDIPFAVLDYSKDPTTIIIVEKMLSSGYFTLTENLNSADEIERAFRSGKTKEVIIFEPHFEQNLYRGNHANVQLIADATDANSANLIVSYTKGEILSYVKSLNTNVKVPYQIKINERMLFNEEMKSSNMFVPGIMSIILLLISAMLTSLSITGEKEAGTIDILLISPLKPSEIIIGKVIPYFLLSLVNGFTILIIGHFVFGVPIVGNVLLLTAVIMLYILLSLSLGILISTLSKSRQFAMFVSMFALMLPSILLSGFIFPTENMPIWLQLISDIVPPKWFLLIIKSVMLKGASLNLIWKPILVLSLMTFFFLFVSIKKFKMRVE